MTHAAFIPATYADYNSMTRDLRAARRSYDLGAYADSCRRGDDLLARIATRTWGAIEPALALELHTAALAVRDNSRGALRCWSANLEAA